MFNSCRLFDHFQFVLIHGLNIPVSYAILVFTASDFTFIILHGLQHARLLCPSPTPRACSNSYPLIPSNHLVLCHPLLLPPSIFPSIRVFSNDSALHIRWPKNWSFRFNVILPMNIQDCFPLEFTDLISLKLYCL